jgi:hypothetical protein
MHGQNHIKFEWRHIYSQLQHIFGRPRPICDQFSQNANVLPINCARTVNGYPAKVYVRTSTACETKNKTKREKDTHCTYNVTSRRVSCNHCCSRKAVSITYSKCVFVPLSIQHAINMPRIILCFVVCPAVQYFSTVTGRPRPLNQGRPFLKNCRWAAPPLKMLPLTLFVYSLPSQIVNTLLKLKKKQVIEGRIFEKNYWK